MEVAETTYKVGNVSWVDELAFHGVTNTGYELTLNSRPEPGEEAQAAKPTDLILIALAGCTGMDVISILKKKRQPVTGFEVNTRGVQAPNPPNVYTEIHIEYVVRGEGVDPAAVERAIELSEGKYCSVSAMLKKTAEVTTSYRLES
jgi:putative redox protein